MNNIQNKKLINKRDILIITAVFSAAAAAFIILSFYRESGKNAVISVGNETKMTLELNDKAETEGFELEGAVIEVQKGRIRVKSSDCPDKVCVHTGFISKKGEKIVCLPKKLIIEIE